MIGKRFLVAFLGVRERTGGYLPMKLSKAVEGFIFARLADGYSPNTMDVYKWALVRLERYLENPEVVAIKLDDLRRFMLFMRAEYKPSRMNGDESPLSGSSMENIWKAIRSFFRWASEEIEIERPDLNLVKPEYSAPEIIPYTEKEVKLLLKVCGFTSSSTGYRKSFSMRRPTCKRDRAIVLVLLDTGIRASEIARLELDNINFQTGAINITPFGTGRKTKGRTVYLGKVARGALWLYTAEREGDENTLFLTIKSRPMNRNSIRQMVNNLGERAGIKKAYPHRFRHTFAIQFLRNGGDIFSLQRLLGHASLEMVQKYLKLAQVDTQNAHRRASPVDRWGL